MSKYIKLEDAINKMDEWFCEPYTPTQLLSDLPTIDIVACEDCKHGEYREDFDDYLCDQLGLGSVNDADFFCSCGERKDNE